MSDVMSLDALNKMNSEEAMVFFRCCCHSNEWAYNMLNTRPFHSIEQLLNTADALWNKADTTMILEAFSAHARIGDKQALLQKSNVSYQEQGHLEHADDELISQLTRANQIYYQKFGFNFIACATNKSAESLLEMLLLRLENTCDKEIQQGALEQGAITRLRLRKWIVSEFKSGKESFE